VFLAVGNVGIDRKVSVMVQKQMKFDRPFGSAKLRPGEKSQAQSDGGRIEGEQFVPETEFEVFGSGHLTHAHCFIKQIAKHLPRSVGIRVGKGRLLWGFVHPQMFKLSHGASQPTTNLS